jgi:hypothetical protein
MGIRPFQRSGLRIALGNVAYDLCVGSFDTVEYPTRNDIAREGESQFLIWLHPDQRWVPVHRHRGTADVSRSRVC